MGEEGFHVGGGHVFGMPFVMKEDKLSDPTDIGFLGTNRVMEQSHLIPNPI
jgi:hypothetical protein